VATAHQDLKSSREGLTELLARLSLHAVEDAPEAIEALERCAGDTRRIAAHMDEGEDRSTLEAVSQLLSEVAVTAERTRRRLARLALDVHDGPLQEVAALRLHLHVLRSGPSGAGTKPTTADVAAVADDVDARLEKLYRELRELVDSFEKPSLVEANFQQVVRDHVREYSRDTGITATLSMTGDPSLLTRSQRIALFRVLTEALTNAHRHACANRVSVSVHVQKKHARLRIRDNGKGFDPKRTPARAARKGRIGLAGMAERVRLLGGTLDIASQRGGPTTITAVVPAGRVEESPRSRKAPRSRTAPSRLTADARPRRSKSVAT
jgi:signal transduction histidine kinase